MRSTTTQLRSESGTSFRLGRCCPTAELLCRKLAQALGPRVFCNIGEPWAAVGSLGQPGVALLFHEQRWSVRGSH